MWVGGDGGGHVPRHVNFWHDGDVAFGGVGDDFFDFFLGVKSSVAFAVRSPAIEVGRGGGTVGSDFGELWIFFDFNAPTLVLGEVPVEGVELVKGEPVDEFLDVSDVKHVAANVEVHAAPAKAWAILDAAGGNRLFAFERDQLEERLDAVKGASCVCADNLDAVGANLERVGLWRIFSLFK